MRDDIKNLIGVILIVLSLYTFFTTYEQYPGEAMYGALTVFIVIILIGVGLIYSTQHKRIQEEKRKEKDYKEKKIASSEISEKKDSLRNLKEKGILSESEYDLKILEINESLIQTEIENTTEYKQLKKLYSSQILTKEEFEEKVKIAREKLSNKSMHSASEEKLNSRGLQQIGEFKEGLAKIWDEDQNYGFINEDNEIVVEPRYLLTWDYSEGLALVMLHNQFGFIDKKGEVVIHLQYDDATSFENGIAKVRLGKEEFYIDKTGKEVEKVSVNTSQEEYIKNDNNKILRLIGLIVFVALYPMLFVLYSEGVLNDFGNFFYQFPFWILGGILTIGFYKNLRVITIGLSLITLIFTAAIIGDMFFY